MITEDPLPVSQPLETPLVDIPERGDIQQRPPVFTPNNPPWGIGKAIIVWFLSVVCLVLVPLVLVIPYIVYLAMNTGLPTGEALEQNKMVVVLSIIGVVPAHLLTLATAWALITSWGRYPFWQSLGFSWPPSIGKWKGLGLSFAVALVLLGVGVAVTAVLGGGKTQLDVLVDSSYVARLSVAFLAFATAPLVEEIVYRGVLYPPLQRVLGLGWAIGIVSALFAGVHVLQYHNNIGVILVITLLSVTLTVIRAWTGRLLPTVVIHLIFNGIQSLVLIVEPLVRKPDVTPSVPGFLNLIRHLF